MNLDREHSVNPVDLLDNKYRIKRPIGQSGMGVLFEATQVPLGRSVAVEVLKNKHVHDGEIITRFQNLALLSQNPLSDHPS